VPDVFQPETMKIALIGYRNHAETLIKFCLSHTAVKSIIIYHPDSGKLKCINDRWPDERCSATSEIEVLFGVDAVLISAPGKYHYDYIKTLVDHVPAIFCEKPPVVNVAEIDALNKFTAHQKAKIYFNFHMLQSDFFKTVEARIQDKLIGEFIYSSMVITQGIAHNPKMKNNWRFASSDIFDTIVGNLGLHYINLYEHWFDQVQIVNLNKGSYGLHGSVDTVSIDIRIDNGLPSRILLSYAAPYISERVFVFTDGVIRQEDEGIFQYSPRDCFDLNGKFVSPSRKKLIGFDGPFDQNFAALERSVNYFLGIAQKRGRFSDHQFQSGLKTVRNVLLAESDFLR
jgi:predicted dehydrogenase